MAVKKIKFNQRFYGTPAKLWTAAQLFETIDLFRAESRKHALGDQLTCTEIYSPSYFVKVDRPASRTH